MAVTYLTAYLVRAVVYNPSRQARIRPQAKGVKIPKEDAQGRTQNRTWVFANEIEVSNIS